MTTYRVLHIAVAVGCGVLIAAASIGAQLTRSHASDERMTLDSLLRRGRADANKKVTPQQFRVLYANRIRNPFVVLLQRADSLRLTDNQADRISVLQRDFARRTDAVWTPVGNYLAALPDRYDLAEAWDRVSAGYSDVLDELLVEGPVADSLLTSDQRLNVPADTRRMFDPVCIRAMHPSGALGSPAVVGNGPVTYGARGGGGGALAARAASVSPPRATPAC